MANFGNGSRTMAIEVCFSFNFDVIFDLIYFWFRQVKQNQ